MSQDGVMILTSIPDLEELLTRAAKRALDQKEAEQRAEKRLTTREAALELGCSTYHLQDLHKQGLPYEKGRPNYYRLGDLEKFRAGRRLQTV